MSWVEKEVVLPLLTGDSDPGQLFCCLQPMWKALEEPSSSRRGGATFRPKAALFYTLANSFPLLKEKHFTFPLLAVDPLPFTLA